MRAACTKLWDVPEEEGRIYFSRQFDPEHFDPPETITAGPLRVGDDIFYFTEKATYRLVSPL
jgi:hypothetical protein